MRRLRGDSVSGHRFKDASSFRVPTVFCRELGEALGMREMDMKLQFEGLPSNRQARRLFLSIPQ